MQQLAPTEELAARLSWQNPPEVLLELVCECLIRDVLGVSLGFHDPVSLGRRLPSLRHRGLSSRGLSASAVTCSFSHSPHEDSRKDPHASISFLLPETELGRGQGESVERAPGYPAS